jgi:hypothetical protein
VRLRNNNFPREFYVPKDRKVRVRIYEDIPATVVMWGNSKEQPVAIGWRGKANKPAFHYSFRSEERRSQYIAEWLENQRAYSERKKASRAERSKPHTLKLGQILYSSWGYDQTNIDYYEVTKIVGARTVEIRQVELVAVGEQGGPQERVAPAVGSYKSEAMIKRANSDNSVRIASYASAFPWNGEAKSQTGFGYGH